MRAMRSQLLWLGAVAVLASGCSSDQREPGPIVEDRTDLPKDGRVAAFEATSSDEREVGYHNPRTGYSADYSLDVEVTSDGEVERIYFPNGGWVDEFTSQFDNGDGTVTVTDENLREFTVEVPETGGSE
jgi:hypothetical protein